jgi:phosphatidylglycerol---prolipoprotein diacylglyceryl transferase
VISIVLVAVAIALVVYRRVRGHADKRYLDA